MIFYTADLHFLYEPLLSSRPFATVEEMDETLIRNWNETGIAGGHRVPGGRYRV